MKRILVVLASLVASAALTVGVASAGKTTRLTTKNSSSTTTHVCTDTGSGGGMPNDDMDGDGDTITMTGPTVLWPPNHKYVTETITATDSDTGSESMMDTDGTTLMTTATSSQPDGGLGSGNTSDDAKVNMPSNGDETATQTVQLRAERDGVDPTKAGRTYTINAVAMFDGSTNMMETCHATFTVRVPHDQGH